MAKGFTNRLLSDPLDTLFYEVSMEFHISLFIVFPRTLHDLYWPTVSDSARFLDTFIFLKTKPRPLETFFATGS